MQIALSSAAYAAETVLQEKIRPGEVKFLKFPGGATHPNFSCRDVRLPLQDAKDHYTVVVSESYFSKMEPFQCELKDDETVITKIDFTVEPKEFAHENLHVDSTRVELSEEIKKRVEAESALVKQIYSSPLDSLQFTEPFKAPLKSKITSPYGIKRNYNHGKKLGEHLGIDFRAAVGKKIPAANRGKVVLSQELYMSGNLVIIDHGLGIFTQYHHMSKRLVNVGDRVEKGQIVGLAGSTGRVSGPHLHWGANVQGNLVDGFDLINQSKIYFKKSK
ncbi:M23 family metallopeptidase [Bdellovibrio sp. SKB1291214]|uniref:M23 family metallopeptidase n=1 Tax=Bdellovibrio sp. SKB1291214 TaxID=1732569 RepID=UPI00224052A6|nr:M23 family metallopeptidase [Bdellovibrio sp. SKB1291214]UYL09458.1 M23 family metallopeptidase [Bdellovibrio sp. SKB1291214]